MIILLVVKIKVATFQEEGSRGLENGILMKLMLKAKDLLLFHVPKILK